MSIFITRFLRKDFSEGITSKEDKLAYDSASCLPGYLAEGCIELRHPIVEKTKFITYKWFNAGYFEEEEKPEYNEFEWGISSLELYIRNRYRKDMRDGTNKNDSEFVKLMNSLYKKKERNSLVYFGLISIVIVWLAKENNFLEAVTPLIKLADGVTTFSTLRKVKYTIQVPEEKAAEVLSRLTGKSIPEVYNSPKAAKHPQIIEIYEDGIAAAFIQSHKRSEKNDPNILKIVVGGIVKDPHHKG